MSTFALLSADQVREWLWRSPHCSVSHGANANAAGKEEGAPVWQIEYDNTPDMEKGFSGFFSRYFYSWMGRYVSLARAEQLREESFPPPRPEHRTAVAGARLSAAFRTEAVAFHSLIGRRVRFRGSGSHPDANTGGEVCGVLRWLGTVGDALCGGVEWDSALPPYRGDDGGHDGVVYGERLFFPSYHCCDSAPAGLAAAASDGRYEGKSRCCTCEPVSSLVLVASSSSSGNSQMAAGDLPKRMPSLAFVLLSVFRSDIVSLLFMLSLVSMCSMATPWLLSRYVAVLEGTGSLTVSNAFSVVLLIGIKLVEPLVHCKAEQRIARTSGLFATSVTSLLFEKSFTISSSALAAPDRSSGHVLTLASTDVGNIRNFVEVSPFLLVCPMELIICVVLLCKLVGPAALAAAVVLLVLLPLQALLARWQGGIEKDLSAATDRRVQRTNELLSGIRVVKMMGWEPSFLREIQEERRSEELKHRRRLQVSYVLGTLLTDFVTPLMVLSILTVHTLMGKKLTAGIVFPLIAVTTFVWWPLYILPYSVASVMKYRVACGRLTRFLLSSEGDTTGVMGPGIGETNECRHYGPALRKVGVSGREDCDNDRGDNVDDDGDDSVTAAAFKNATVSTAVASPLPRLVPSAPLHVWQRLWGALRRVGIVVACAEDAVPPEKRYVVEDEGVTANCEEVTMTPTPAQGATTAQGTGDDDGGGGEEEESAGRYAMVPKALLTNVSLTIPSGKLTVIVGSTGSGKSSLLHALLGAYTVTQGEMWVRGRIAFVPQQPWILQGTIGDNITFFESDAAKKSEEREKSSVSSWHSPLRSRAFQHARQRTANADAASHHHRSLRLSNSVAASQLATDLASLPDGINTEIGERGVTLSGGQKARVSLARAVYADKDIYLLDDPLSALDAHVSERVMKDCILGALRGKTRVLATHQLHVLPHADCVVVLSKEKGGSVAYYGSYEGFRESGWAAELAAQDSAGEPGNEFSPTGAGLAGKMFPTAASASASLVVDDDDVTCDTKPTAAPSAVALESPPGTHFSMGVRGELGQEEELTNAVSTTAGGGGEGLMSEEEKETGHIPWYVYRAFFAAGGGFWAVARVVVPNVLSEMVYQFGAVLLSLWASHALAPVIQTDAGYLYFYLFAIVVDLVLRLVGTTTFYMFVLAASASLHSTLIRSLISARVVFFDQTPLGRIVNRVTRDINVVDDSLPSNLLMCLTIVLALAYFLLVTVMANPITIFFVVIAGFAFVHLVQLYTTVLREIRRVASIAQSPMFSLLGDVLSGRETIASYGRAPAVFARALHRLDRVYASIYLETTAQQWLTIRVEYIGTCVIVLVAIAGVAARLWSGPDGLSPTRVSLLSLSFTTALNFSWALPEVLHQVSLVEVDMNSVQRVWHYTLEENVPREDVALIASLPPSQPSTVENDAAVAAGTLEATDLQLRYRPGLPLVLKGISFTIAAGQKVGVVGRTGSGKSSLLQALLRLVEPCGGALRVCGRPCQGYTLSELRAVFTMLPQDPVLFEGTVRSNIDPFGACSDREVRQALARVGLADSSSSVAGTAGGEGERVEGIGPDAAVQEGGRNFSVGQRQLLCLARALLKRGSAFLLMDEATANVDPQLDRQVWRVIKECFARHTVITVAHRLRTVAGYDSVMVMGGGRVLESGPPAVLAAQKGSVFRTMVARGETEEEREAAVADFIKLCQEG